jgi:hypothetical protein
MDEVCAKGGRMRKLFAIAAVLLFATTARAQFLGQLSHARVLDQGGGLIGGNVGIYDDNAVAAFGQYRYGLTDLIDAGFKLGFLDPGGSGGTGIAVQGDGRYQLLFQKLKDPLDLSLGGGVEFFFGEDLTITSFLFNGMVSHRLESANGRGITPYGRAQLRAERISVDVGPRNVADTDLEFGLNGGAEFEVAPALALAAELQLDTSVDFGLLFGLNYRF